MPFLPDFVEGLFRKRPDGKSDEPLAQPATQPINLDLEQQGNEVVGQKFFAIYGNCRNDRELQATLKSYNIQFQRGMKAFSGFRGEAGHNENGVLYVPYVNSNGLMIEVIDPTGATKYLFIAR